MSYSGTSGVFVVAWVCSSCFLNNTLPTSLVCPSTLFFAKNESLPIPPDPPPVESGQECEVFFAGCFAPQVCPRLWFALPNFTSPVCELSQSAFWQPSCSMSVSWIMYSQGRSLSPVGVVMRPRLLNHKPILSWKWNGSGQLHRRVDTESELSYRPRCRCNECDGMWCSLPSNLTTRWNWL